MKKFQTDARKYGARLRQHLAGTGGGPPLADPEVAIASMFEIVHGSTGEGVVGIQSGVESGAEMSMHIGKDSSANEEAIEEMLSGSA